MPRTDFSGGTILKQYISSYTARNIAFDEFFHPFKRAFWGVKVAIAGSILRKKETVHDIDIVIGSRNEEILAWVRNIIGSTENSTQKLMGSLGGLHTDVWFTWEEHWAAMLLFATGPKAFNIFLRQRAKAQGMVLNHRGLWVRTEAGGIGERLDNNTEGDIIYRILHRLWIPPEERDFFHFPLRITSCSLCKKEFRKGDTTVIGEDGGRIHSWHITTRNPQAAISSAVGNDQKPSDRSGRRKEKKVL
jgi:DNA polymerase/3'-5' exonuclease PolX